MRRMLSATLVVTFAALPLFAQEAPGVEAFRRLFVVVEARYQTTPDPTDVWFQAGRLGYDPQRIREFVRDEIAYEPYQGLLRGGPGTLFARAGNSLDQALLLSRLLAVGGVSSRIVGRDLEAEEAAVLVRLFLERGPVEADPPRQAERVARELGVQPETVRAIVQERTRRDRSILEEVLEGAERETARLHGLLGDRLKAGAFDLPQRHYWVEIDGQAYDPTGSGLALKGGRPVSEAQVQAARRTVTFRLVLDRAVGDKVETEQLFEIRLPADEIAYRPVDLIVYPEPGELPSLEDVLLMTPQERAQAFEKAGKFRCGLLVDGRTYGGAPFDRQGQVYDVTEDGRVTSARGVGEGVAGAFGGMFGGSEQPATALRAVRLEVAVQAPGAGPRLHKRTIYEAGDTPFPMLRDSFLVETHVLPSGESARREVGLLSQNAQGIRSFLLGDGPPGELRPEAEVSSLLLRFADLRRNLLASYESRPLHEGIGIVRESRQILVDAGTGRTGVRHTIDLMDTALSFITAEGRHSPGTALQMGVAETALEWLLLVRSSPADAEADLSAWTLMDRARVQGHDASVLAEGDKLRVQWADDAWWSVHPETGHCVGRAKGGAGQAMIEYAWKASGAICQAMNPYFSLLNDLDVQAQSLSDIEKLCSLHGIVGNLGGDIDAVLDKGADGFLRDKAKGKVTGAASDMLDIQQKMFNYIQGQTRAMWGQAAGALAGL